MNASMIATLCAFAVLAVISVRLVLVDVREHRLPNRLVFALYAVGILLLTVLTATTGDVGPAVRGLASAGALFVFYLLLNVAGGVGAGDVKLAGALGLFLGPLGWSYALAGAVLAFLLGGLWSGWLLVRRRVERGQRIAFGPFMIGGAWLAIGMLAVG